MTAPQLFHCLRYSDANRGIAFLEALGFTTALVVRDDDDPSLVWHAQLSWRDSGGVMLGSSRGEDDPQYQRGVCNLVVAGDDDVDRLVSTALQHGATVVTEPNDAPHGGRNACVADFDGHWWNLDSYTGA